MPARIRSSGRILSNEIAAFSSIPRGCQNKPPTLGPDFAPTLDGAIRWQSSSVEQSPKQGKCRLFLGFSCIGRSRLCRSITRADFEAHSRRAKLGTISSSRFFRSRPGTSRAPTCTRVHDVSGCSGSMTLPDRLFRWMERAKRFQSRWAPVALRRSRKGPAERSLLTRWNDQGGVIAAAGSVERSLLFSHARPMRPPTLLRPI